MEDKVYTIGPDNKACLGEREAQFRITVIDNKLTITMPSTTAALSVTVVIIAALVVQNIFLRYQISLLSTEKLMARTDLQVCSAQSDSPNQNQPKPTPSPEQPVTTPGSIRDNADSVAVNMHEHGTYIDQDMRKSSPVVEKGMKPPLSGSKETEAVSSFAWCHEENNRVCQLENVCYNSDVNEFVLFIDKSSLIINVNMEYGMFKIDTSSVKNHNAHQVLISALPREIFDNFTLTWIQDTSLIFSPFLPDNTMHLFHDDLLPLHHTLQIINSNLGLNHLSKFHTNLFIYQKKNYTFEDNIIELYESVTHTKLRYINDLQLHGKFTCFRQLYIGLSSSTVWYDYGFEDHQKQVLKPILHAGIIRRTTSHLLKHLDISPNSLMSSHFIIILSRKQTRKILNEAGLIFQIIKNTGMKVVNLNLENYSLSEIISYILEARGIISVHGSLLILSMFLKPGSFVMELFPYAVNPQMYTPYRTLCNIPHMNIIYKSWTNQHKENSIGHPDWPAELGGLEHLGESLREAILAETEVKPHKCCTDPSWLYHINQDTKVDIGSIVNIVMDALSESKSKLVDPDKSLNHILLRPSQVQGVICNYLCRERDKKLSCDVDLHWEVPWNIQYITYTTLTYHVLVQDQGTSDSTIVIEEKCSDNKLSTMVLIPGQSHSHEYLVWVKGTIDNVYDGPYSNAVPCLSLNNL